MNTWLKIICIALLGYVLVFAFKTPLIPGGLQVDIEKLSPGQNEFTYIGYNTHFLEERGSLKIFVMSDSIKYCTEIIDVADNNHARIKVFLPDTLPSNRISFFANNNLDGTVGVSKALDIRAFVFDKNNTKGSCESTVQTNKFDGKGFPFQIKIYESIRNLMFHVPMWFTMFFLMIMSFAYGLKYLSGAKKNGSNDETMSEILLSFDRKAADYAKVGLVFCVLGLITGSMWARVTWDKWWTGDPQLNGALAVFLAYCAYLILRASTPDLEKRARLSAIYNIFAFVMMVILLMIMPRYYDSMHPGKGGNPAFDTYDLDSNLRMVFYPAVIGWILLGYWIYTIKNRISNLYWRSHEQD